MKRKFLAVLLLASLTGCATLPVSGPVRIGPDLAPPSDSTSFYYSPSTPVDGASETEILAGFLAAGTAPQNDYAIAREYLSESIRATWNPNQELLIQKTTPQVTLTDSGIAFVEVEVTARVDSNGRYETLPAGSTRTLEYTFSEQAGQIRLSGAPDVTIVIRPVFDVVFRSYSVYFLDHAKSALVPELRWFPANPATGTKLVNALLAGPSEWLKPAVVSAIPTGTVLSLDAVTVQDEVALVDLSARALVASLSDRSLMKAQLVATLSQLPTITKVSISIERSAQDIPDSELDLSSGPSGTMVALGEDGLRAVSGAAADEIPAGLSFFGSRDVTNLALSTSASKIAAATSAGVFETALDNPGAAVKLLDARTNLSAVHYDRLGKLWLVSGSQISVDSKTVVASWLSGQIITAFALSPEGSRAALIVDRGATNQVLLASVIRNQSGTPIELALPIALATELSNPTLVSWFDQVTLSILTSQPDSSNVALVEIGGGTRLVQGLVDTKSLVALGDGSALYLLKDSGELFTFRGSFWASIASSVSAIALLK
jgi:hypothetical protein